MGYSLIFDIVVYAAIELLLCPVNIHIMQILSGDWNDRLEVMRVTYILPSSRFQWKFILDLSVVMEIVRISRLHYSG